MKRPNHVRLVFYILTALGIAAALFSLAHSGAQPVAPLFEVGCAGALCSLLVGTVTVRCPHCGCPLGLNELYTARCRGCGEFLDELASPRALLPHRRH